MFQLQEILTESGQLQFAREDILRARGFECRDLPHPHTGIGQTQDEAVGSHNPPRRLEWSYGAGGRRFVIPVEEMVEAFWACPTGQKMKVRECL